MVNYSSGQAENVSQSHTETREETETGRQARSRTDGQEQDTGRRSPGRRTESPERSCPDKLEGEQERLTADPRPGQGVTQRRTQDPETMPEDCRRICLLI